MSGISRRNFLGWGIATVLSSGLGACAKRPTKIVQPLANAQIVVLGGGYAGATAARTLRMLDPTVRVTLIERNARYYSCPGSNEILAGSKHLKDIKRDHKQLAKARGIQFVNAETTSVDVQRRMVKLSDGPEVPYDRLIVAPGIDFRWKAIEGYDEEASFTVPHAWKAGHQTMLLRRQLRAMPKGGVVLITVPANPYRCPPGPYERASLIAHFLKRYKPRAKIILLDDKTQFPKQSLFLQGWREFYPGMVEWISSEKNGRLERIDAENRVVYSEFGKHQADVLNVIPPQKAGNLAYLMGLTDASGWCPVDLNSFESSLIPKIHVIGDACIATPMPKSAFAANAQAKLCALAVIDLLHGREPGAAPMINHCYSLLDPDHAISVTGVYAYSAKEKQMVATATAETQPHADWKQEARQARDWQKLLAQDVFG